MALRQARKVEPRKIEPVSNGEKLNAFIEGIAMPVISCSYVLRFNAPSRTITPPTRRPRISLGRSYTRTIIEVTNIASNELRKALFASQQPEKKRSVGPSKLISAQKDSTGRTIYTETPYLPEA